ncbi:MAG: penicillin-binding protein 2, partial [Clostridia bacterium]|nr:penicillin-binding protein 2 [Clostridia bacterium]
MIMQKKLLVLFLFVLVAFVTLNMRLMKINKDNGETYKKQVLSQQEYDSIVLPAKRGDIIDAKGTKIAVSEKVYHVVVDAKAMSAESGKYLNPSIQAIYSAGIQSEYTEAQLREYVQNNSTSQYRVIAKKQKYDAVSSLMEIINDPEKYPDVKGIWLEDAYQRYYPYGSLACDVIGFVQGDEKGNYGLEEFYDESLNGINGREYGYLNDDENLERTIKPAQDGNTLVTSLDVNVQSIVEKHILAFNEEHKNEYREGNGSTNTGVVIMNPNTGEIIAMASYPVYDLNNPRDLSRVPQTILDAEIEKMRKSSSDNTISDDSISNLSLEEKEAKLNEDGKWNALAALWRNFCIADTYEPGSTMKPFTLAAGLEGGKLSGNENFDCQGVLHVGDHDIHCNNRLGHGMLDVQGALDMSCNVAFMNMGEKIGKSEFMKYNRIFNFGLKTNVDLAGEALTNTVIFDESKMNPTDLAIGSFGQGFNVTMVQMISGFCSLINGGYYYKPHVVSEIVNSDGATVQKIEPRVIKQTVSATTSDEIRKLCVSVIENGTGKSARPAGYRIGGKTGTAEKTPRGTENYVVSFMGFAPADDPQLVIYCVIDEPNVDYQPTAKYATVLAKDILTEVLQYMNVFQTEELT